MVTTFITDGLLATQLSGSEARHLSRARSRKVDINVPAINQEIESFDLEAALCFLAQDFLRGNFPEVSEDAKRRSFDLSREKNQLDIKSLNPDKARSKGSSK